MAYFDGKFHAVWNANTVNDEGVGNQRVLWSTSTDFISWTTPTHFVGSSAGAVNPQDWDSETRQWQPNLLNYNDQQLWCVWYQSSSGEKTNLYVSTLDVGGSVWTNREILHRATIKGYTTTPFSGQNPYLLSSGRVIVPLTFSSNGSIYPDYPYPYTRVPRFNAIAYSDDGGQTWGISNIFDSPEHFGAIWEVHSFEQFDGLIRSFFILRSAGGFPIPMPTKRFLTVVAQPGEPGEPVKVEADARYSHIETAVSRMQTIRLSSDRYCLLAHDLYTESGAYESRHNIAMFFSRTGRDDFVAGPGIQPRNEIGAYPQGIEHDGKIYVVYTVGGPAELRRIEGVVVDPAPSAEQFYIWPRNKDLLELDRVNNQWQRTNTDYSYTAPYQTTYQGRDVIHFKDRGTAGVEIDPLDFASRQTLNLEFEACIDQLQPFGYAVLCSFGDHRPIRIGMPSNRPGKLYAETADGWKYCGDMPLGEFRTIAIQFSGGYFTVQVGDSDKQVFPNPVRNPNPRLYLGDGYEVDYFAKGQAAIRSNADSEFYIDIDSFLSYLSVDDVIVEARKRPVYGQSESPIIAAEPPFVAAPVLGNEAIHLAFDGGQSLLGDHPNTSAWENKGRTGYSEMPGAIGSFGAEVYPLLTDGIKGNAYSGQNFNANMLSRTYAWGTPTQVDDTTVERGLSNIWSFTVSGWIHTGPGGVYNINNARILRMPALELINKVNYLQLRIGRNGNLIDTPPVNMADGWLFFAVVYDGTVAHDTNGNALEDNVFVYVGTESNEVSLLGSLKAQTNEGGWLVRDGNGAMLTLGNQTVGGSRPWLGQIDELRIWANGPEMSSDPKTPLSVLSLAELENVRRYDLLPPDDTVTYFLRGDINRDASVDMLDFLILAEDWLLTLD